jgi:hypothetical protein
MRERKLEAAETRQYRSQLFVCSSLLCVTWWTIANLKTYRYRYGTLIVFANYLIEIKEGKNEATFPEWLREHREITKLLGRRSLD